MTLTRRASVSLVFLSLLAVTAANAQLDNTQTNAYIKNEFIQAGLNEYGCYGSSNGSVLPAGYYTPANTHGNGVLGFICSPQNTWPEFYGDFMLPGAPYEGFSVTYTSTATGQTKTVINRKDGGSQMLPRTTPAFTYNQDYSDVTWHGIYAGVFEIDCRFRLDGARIIHTTTIKNISTDTYTDVYFVRGMDPDQENGDGGGVTLPPEVICSWVPDTKNFIQAQANGSPGSYSWVTANGTCAQSSISLYSDDPNSRVGISVGWYSFLNNPVLGWGPSSPGNYYTQVDEYSRTEPFDWSIELAIFIGEIAPGQSKEVEHEIGLDQPPVINFSTEGLDASTGDFSLTKSEGETFTYTLIRQYQLEETVTVEVELSSVAGATAADFDGVASLPKTYTSVFGPNETEKTISVTAAYDAVSDDNEKFQLEIASITSSIGGLATLPDKVYGIIKDVPLPVASFDPSSCTSVEEGNDCVITIKLSPTPLPEIGDAVLNLSFGNEGTATFGASETAGVDYTITPLTNMTYASGSTYEIRIAPGETTATFRLKALSDNIYEPGNETVVPHLTVVGNAVVNPVPTKIAVTIVDKTAAPVLKINAIDEVSASESSPLNYILTLEGSTCSANVTVQCTTADGSAIAGADYVTKTETITFAPGETSKAFSVETLGDKWLEEDEILYINLANAVNCTLASAQTNGTIKDRTDGTIIVVKQTPENKDASENPLTHGSFRVKFKDSDVKSTRPVKVEYSLEGGSTLTRDHTVAPTPVGEAVILDGENHVDVNITVIDNYLIQGNHYVKIIITAAILI
ncbi:MAG: hypothetical protein LBG19_13045 [Prevotellaceae bacterium]|nr:hypothetical protein [Prevotellaceae bacterium]